MPEALGAKLARRANSDSTNNWNAGIMSEKPNRAITITEKLRSESAGTPNNLTIEVRNKVKKVKLKIKPTTMPYGLFLLLSSVSEVARMTGKIGKIQGERIVTMPAKNAKIISITIYV